MSSTSTLLLILISSLVNLGCCAFQIPTLHGSVLKYNPKATAFHSPPGGARSTHQSLSMSSSNTNNSKEIYGIPDSGWSSSSWNWGSAMGTGHDCAAICRRRWGIRENRSALVQLLIKGQAEDDVTFEELKLILGLAWQNGRWNGSDGGAGGYSQVLAIMAEARRYELGNEVKSALNFIEDVRDRFSKIARNEKEMETMESIANGVLQLIDKDEITEEEKDHVFLTRRMCAGMVLDAMNFVENGL